MKKILFLVGLFLNGLVGFAQTNSSSGYITMIPDSSLTVISKLDTFYVLQAEGSDNLYFTSDKALYGHVISWISDNVGNGVKVIGTKIDPLSKFYRSQFKTFASKFEKRGMELNKTGFLFRLTGYLPLTEAQKREMQARDKQNVSASPSYVTPPGTVPRRDVPVQTSPQQKESIWDKLKRQ